ncbi:hypothetical protein SPI_03667 [Niveomyces insectorum RCEF 264]|uniref:Uncharacterized protein n=1 Tax=Niveomyces insectorum RCEF 264 TaxID=1081102 RepID=A0A167W9I2_9HYPO|nr:hypothetical protein SPI_03667 [Niveomyces insectorum RCEF 264]
MLTRPRQQGFTAGGPASSGGGIPGNVFGAAGAAAPATAPAPAADAPVYNTNQQIQYQQQPYGYAANVNYAYAQNQNAYQPQQHQQPFPAQPQQQQQQTVARQSSFTGLPPVRRTSTLVLDIASLIGEAKDKLPEEGATEATAVPPTSTMDAPNANTGLLQPQQQGMYTTQPVRVVFLSHADAVLSSRVLRKPTTTAAAAVPTLATTSALRWLVELRIGATGVDSSGVRRTNATAATTTTTTTTAADKCNRSKQQQQQQQQPPPQSWAFQPQQQQQRRQSQPQQQQQQQQPLQNQPFTQQSGPYQPQQVAFHNAGGYGQPGFGQQGQGFGQYQQQVPQQQPQQQQQPGGAYPPHGQHGSAAGAGGNFVQRFFPKPGWKLEESHLQEPLVSTRHRTSPTATPEQQSYSFDKETEVMTLGVGTGTGTRTGTGTLGPIAGNEQGNTLPPLQAVSSQTQQPPPVQQFAVPGQVPPQQQGQQQVQQQLQQAQQEPQQPQQQPLQQQPYQQQPYQQPQQQTPTGTGIPQPLGPIQQTTHFLPGGPGGAPPGPYHLTNQPTFHQQPQPQPQHFQPYQPQQQQQQLQQYRQQHQQPPQQYIQQQQPQQQQPQQLQQSWAPSSSPAPNGVSAAPTGASTAAGPDERNSRFSRLAHWRISGHGTPPTSSHSAHPPQQTQQPMQPLQQHQQPQNMQQQQQQFYPPYQLQPQQQPQQPQQLQQSQPQSQMQPPPQQPAQQPVQAQAPVGKKLRSYLPFGKGNRASQVPEASKPPPPAVYQYPAQTAPPAPTQQNPSPAPMQPDPFHGPPGPVAGQMQPQSYQVSPQSRQATPQGYQRLVAPPRSPTQALPQQQLAQPGPVLSFPEGQISQPGPSPPPESVHPSPENAGLQKPLNPPAAGQRGPAETSPPPGQPQAPAQISSPASAPDPTSSVGPVPTEKTPAATTPPPPPQSQVSSQTDSRAQSPAQSQGPVPSSSIANVGGSAGPTPTGEPTLRRSLSFERIGPPGSSLGPQPEPTAPTGLQQTAVPPPPNVLVPQGGAPGPNVVAQQLPQQAPFQQQPPQPQPQPQQPQQPLRPMQALQPQPQLQTPQEQRPQFTFNRASTFGSIVPPDNDRSARRGTNLFSGILGKVKGKDKTKAEAAAASTAPGAGTSTPSKPQGEQPGTAIAYGANNNPNAGPPQQGVPSPAGSVGPAHVPAAPAPAGFVAPGSRLRSASNAPSVASLQQQQQQRISLQQARPQVGQQQPPQSTWTSASEAAVPGPFSGGPSPSPLSLATDRRQSLGQLGQHPLALANRVVSSPLSSSASAPSNSNNNNNNNNKTNSPLSSVRNEKMSPLSQTYALPPPVASGAPAAVPGDGPLPNPVAPLALVRSRTPSVPNLGGVPRKPVGAAAADRPSLDKQTQPRVQTPEPGQQTGAQGPVQDAGQSPAPQAGIVPPSVATIGRSIERPSSIVSNLTANGAGSGPRPPNEPAVPDQDRSASPAISVSSYRNGPVSSSGATISPTPPPSAPRPFAPPPSSTGQDGATTTAAGAWNGTVATQISSAATTAPPRTSVDNPQEASSVAVASRTEKEKDRAKKFFGRFRRTKASTDPQGPPPGGPQYPPGLAPAPPGAPLRTQKQPVVLPNDGRDDALRSSALRPLDNTARSSMQQQRPSVGQEARPAPSLLQQNHTGSNNTPPGPSQMYQNQRPAPFSGPVGPNAVPPQHSGGGRREALMQQISPTELRQQQQMLPPQQRQQGPQPGGHPGPAFRQQQRPPQQYQQYRQQQQPQQPQQPQRRTAEPQYGEVPIPRGYAPVHGEGTLAPSQYNLGRTASFLPQPQPPYGNNQVPLHIANAGYNGQMQQQQTPPFYPQQQQQQQQPQQPQQQQWAPMYNPPQALIPGGQPLVPGQAPVQNPVQTPGAVSAQTSPSQVRTSPVVAGAAAVGTPGPVPAPQQAQAQPGSLSSSSPPSGSPPTGVAAAVTPAVDAGDGPATQPTGEKIITKEAPQPGSALPAHPLQQHPVTAYTVAPPPLLPPVVSRFSMYQADETENRPAAEAVVVPLQLQSSPPSPPPKDTPPTERTQTASPLAHQAGQEEAVPRGPDETQQPAPAVAVAAVAAPPVAPPVETPVSSLHASPQSTQLQLDSGPSDATDEPIVVPDTNQHEGASVPTAADQPLSATPEDAARPAAAAAAALPLTPLATAAANAAHRPDDEDIYNATPRHPDTVADATPTSSTGHAEPTAALAGSVEPAGPAKPFESTTTGPAVSAGPADPAGPTTTTEPSVPTEPVRSVESYAPVEPTESVEHIDAAASLVDHEPAAAVVEPAEPVGEPVAPVESTTPLPSGAAAAAVVAAESAEPTRPADLVALAKSVEPIAIPARAAATTPPVDVTSITSPIDPTNGPDPDFDSLAPPSPVDAYDDDDGAPSATGGLVLSGGAGGHGLENGNGSSNGDAVGRQKTIRQTSAQQYEEYKRRQMLKVLEEKIPVFVPDEEEEAAALAAAAAQKQKEQDEPQMSATSYPGQEWNPYDEFAYVDDE